MKEKSQYNSFQDFWPDYLGDHKSPLNRKLHFTGVFLGILMLVVAILTRRAMFIPMGFFLGYLCAWTGHFVIEKNRPATFQHPLWSLRGDFYMTYLAATGQLDEIRKKHNV